MKKNTLYLLRHGKLSQKQVLAGHTDFLLSDEGQQQLIDATSTLPMIEHIYSSSLSRCGLFAKRFSVEKNIPLEITDALKEMHFGDWDGKKFDTLWEERNESTSKKMAGLITGSSVNNDIAPKQRIHIGDFWENPWKNSPPNGETMEQFTQRIDHWWQTFICKPKTGNRLLISHAGVIKHLLTRITGLNIKKPESLQVFDVPYAAVIRIDITHDEKEIAWPKIVF